MAQNIRHLGQGVNIFLIISQSKGRKPGHIFQGRFFGHYPGYQSDNSPQHIDRLFDSDPLISIHIRFRFCGCFGLDQNLQCGDRVRQINRAAAIHIPSVLGPSRACKKRQAEENHHDRESSQGMEP